MPNVIVNIYDQCAIILIGLLTAQADALNAEHSSIRDSLNIDEILSFLNAKSLLTPDEQYRLRDTNQPWGKRIDFLIEILPRKKSDWWNGFLHCLDKSSSRPGLEVHKELADQLRGQFNQRSQNYEVSMQSSYISVSIHKLSFHSSTNVT